MSDETPPRVRRLDVLTATVDQLQAELAAVDEQVSILLGACACLFVIMVVLAIRLSRVNQ